MSTFGITCGSCGLRVAAAIVGQSTTQKGHLVLWLQCPDCGDGSVRTGLGAVYPSSPAGRAVKNLPDEIEQAWQEARTAHAVAAYTASEMMCRKILMHLAVDIAGSKAGKKFVEYVDDLDAAGYITRGMKPVVDKVRDRGNIANHELPASAEQDSLTTMAITEHLLESIYELPALAGPLSP